MSACCFCSSFVSAELTDSWNKPLLESSNFVVVPSLGSLVEGWVLIVPKKHFICIGALSDGLLNEMENVKSDVSSHLGRLYGDLCLFEHGPSMASRSVGCGVDHAHLHIVPLNFDLVNAAIPFLPDEGVSWRRADSGSCRAAYKNGLDYLYVEQPLTGGRIATHSNFGSQVFRKAIASVLNIPEKFSWREYPQTHMVGRTISALTASLEVAI